LPRAKANPVAGDRGARQGVTSKERIAPKPIAGTAQAAPQPHPLANLFPPLEGEEFAELVADIAAHGLNELIVLHEGMILDGRNRYRACLTAGVAPRLKQFDGKDPLAFVISANLKRRHLNESGRAMVAARLANWQVGDNQFKGPSIDGASISQEQAGKLLNVSTKSVERAKIVLDRAEPELLGAVERGKIAVSLAAQAVILPAAQQREVAEKAAAGYANVVQVVVNKARRAQREAELGAKQCALPDKKYGVIYADPEYQWVAYSSETGLDRAPDNHYPTSDPETLKARDVPSIAAKDCVLFLWSPPAMRDQAQELMKAWGFRYVSEVVWEKDQEGKGIWFRNWHETLLVGTRGNIPAPAMGTQWPSIIKAPRGEHSAKPEIFCELIEAYYPSLPKIELNRRGPARPGWDAWGNEAESASSCGRLLRRSVVTDTR
jgi:N6-adenosine-specific RNA methylase IME4/ParB-like chromosome segregation protein Spo0J